MVSGGAGHVSGGETPIFNYQVASGGHHNHKKQLMMQKRDNCGSGSQHA
jgi:hypothetical protein